MAESLLYKTPSPVCAKRRLSGIPVRTTTGTHGDGLGPERVPNDAVRRIVSSGLDRPGSGDAPWRRGSFSGTSDVLKKLDEETESVDSSMGFRELERHIAKVKRQNFDLKLELHLRRERMTANAEKIHRAEKLALENEQLRETLHETRASLKARDEEITDCRSLIRLLSDQLEIAHRRIAALTGPQKKPSLPSISIPSPSTDGSSHKESPTSESSVYPDDDSLSSPVSLVSLESGIRSHYSDDEPTDVAIVKLESEEPTEQKESAESIHEIHLPPQLEHSPRTIRRVSRLDQISQLPTPSHSTPYYNDHHRGPLLASKRMPKLVTPVVTRVNAEVTHLPPTPEETPLPMKQATQRATTLRSRIFHSKSDLKESTTAVASQPTPPPTTTKSVPKKNSLLRFWKSKCSSNSSKGDPQKKHPSTIPTPTHKKDAAPRPSEQSSPFTAPHESDKLSRYPKVRPTTSYTTTRSTTTTTTTTNPEWRHSTARHISKLSETKVSDTTSTTNPDWRRSVGRQVSDMVQHWEHESTTRSTRPLSCAAYICSKRSSTGTASLKDFGVAASPMAVRAARDAWTQRASSVASVARSESLRSVAGGRMEAVKKLGVGSVSVAVGAR